jgi:hypothetical protein
MDGPGKTRFTPASVYIHPDHRTERLEKALRSFGQYGNDENIEVDMDNVGP